jgi:hypothetical protein
MSDDISIGKQAEAEYGQKMEDELYGRNQPLFSVMPPAQVDIQKDKLALAAYTSQRFGIPMDYALERSDQLRESIFPGLKSSDNLFKNVAKQWKLEGVTRELHLVSAQLRDNSPSANAFNDNYYDYIQENYGGGKDIQGPGYGTTAPAPSRAELEAKRDVLRKQKKQLTNEIRRPEGLAGAIGDAAGSISYMRDGLLVGAVGSVINPALGMAAAATYNLNLYTGGAYEDMLESGIDEETAKNLFRIFGAIIPEKPKQPSGGSC